MKATAGSLMAVCMSTALMAADESYTGPIIDVHLHSFENEGIFRLCMPWITQFPAWDTRRPWGEVAVEAMTSKVPCDSPIEPVSPANNDLLNTTLSALKEHDIKGIVSGSPDESRRWQENAPEHFLASLQYRIGRDGWTINELRELLSSGDFIALGEVSNQYGGIAPDDERMMPVWALAEELDIPVAIHMGEGIMGTPHIGIPDMQGFRARLSNPLLLEDILARHPRLRISVMHFGAPFVDEMIALMGSHPQVYADIGGMQWYYPREAFYGHLKKMVDAGYSHRIMFG